MSLFVVPQNPGTRIAITGEETQRPPASIAETVAVVGTHNWGPSRTPYLVSSFGEFEAIFGSSDTDLRDAVLGAFVGPGLDRYAGAGAVIVYRAGLSAGGTSLNKATLSVTNTTPVAAVRFDALYNGTRGNSIKIAKDDDPAAPTTRDRVRILLDDVTVESFSYEQTDLASLVALVNGRASKYVSAALLQDGVALTPTAGTALAAGRDGTPITVTEYSEAADALSFQPFSVLVAANLTDTAIQATLKAWVAEQEDAMRPVRFVEGGPSTETLDQADTRTDSSRDIHVVSLAVGSVHDDFLDKDIGGAKLAPRVAGALAGIGNARSLTYLPFAGLTLNDPIQVPTDRLREASDKGLTALTRASSTEGELVINRGVTSFITEDAAHPLEIFTEPRLVGIIDDFIRRVKQWGDANIVGLPNTETTRASVRDYGSGLLSKMFGDGLILNAASEPYYFRTPDPDPANPDLIPFEFGFQFAQTTNYLVGVGKVRV